MYRLHRVARGLRHVRATPAIAAAALLAAGCAHSRQPEIEPPEGQFLLVGPETVPVFAYLPESELRAADDKRAGKPRTQGHGRATHGAYTGVMFAAGAFDLCGSVASANLLAGAVVCAVAVPVGLVAIPIGAVVGTMVGTPTPLDPSTTAQPPPPTSDAPAEISPTPRWWRECRVALLDGVGARAADTGFAVTTGSGAAPLGTARLETAIVAFGLVPDGEPLLRPYAKIRARLVVKERTVADQTFTRFGSRRQVLGEWFRSDQDALRESVLELAGEASETIVAEVLLPNDEALAAVPPPPAEQP